MWSSCAVARLVRTLRLLHPGDDDGDDDDHYGGDDNDHYRDDDNDHDYYYDDDDDNDCFDIDHGDKIFAGTNALTASSWWLGPLIIYVYLSYNGNLKIILSEWSTHHE